MTNTFFNQKFDNSVNEGGLALIRCIVFKILHKTCFVNWQKSNFLLTFKLNISVWSLLLSQSLLMTC